MGHYMSRQKQEPGCNQAPQQPRRTGGLMSQSITDDTISNLSKNAENKSKARGDELKRLFDSSSVNKTETTSLSEEKKAKLEETIIEELNRTLAIVHTTSTYILIEKNDVDFVLDSKASLLVLYENQVVPELGESSKKRVTKAQIWLRSPRRRTFQNIVFNPRVVGHYDGNFNIWRGFAVEPIKGECSLFWDHVRDNICGGKQSHLYNDNYLCRSATTNIAGRRQLSLPVTDLSI